MSRFAGRLTTKFPGESYPGPYVLARIDWRGASRDVQALIDCGADQSLIPLVTAEALKLQQIDEVEIYDANGNSEPRPVFAVNLAFHGFSVAALPVAATNYPIMLIGRDVLSSLVTELNGPEQTFSLTS